MKADTYTKFLLTIIAGCLMLLVFQNSALVPKAQAGTAIPVNHVIVPTNADGSINVRLAPNEVMKVDIDRVAGLKTPQINGCKGCLGVKADK